MDKIVEKIMGRIIQSIITVLINDKAIPYFTSGRQIRSFAARTKNVAVICVCGNRKVIAFFKPLAKITWDATKCELLFALSWGVINILKDFFA